MDHFRRLRTTKACTLCRKKKIRCDGLQPNCKNCQQTQNICIFSESKKRGPRKGYVQSLEERLAQMEKRFLGDLSPLDDLPPLETMDHLIDIFFTHINAFVPFIHRTSLKKSIRNKTISRPLLYSVMAISARFSDNPSIRTNPPYLAGEGFAKKALSLVDASMFQPSMTNIQFWGIMSCIEYGRSSGSMCWIYATLAIRFCQELGYHKEETLSSPILAEDGSIDAVSMALRRRIFWSCLMLDKYSSAGTHRTQCIDQTDCNSHSSNVAEILLLRDPELHKDIQGNLIREDSLLNVAQYYVTCVEKFGQVNQNMQNNSTTWPPIAEYRNLDRQLCLWKENLPEHFQFTPENLRHHQRFASAQNLALWLNSHITWCSSMMILHRGSLAYVDQSLGEEQDRRVKTSVETCHVVVDYAMDIFAAMKDACKHILMPYTTYSAYVFATLLTHKSFSKTPEEFERCQRSLRMLFELIQGVAPYWLMCEKLANTTKELLMTHERLYGHAVGLLPAQSNPPPTDGFSSLYSSTFNYPSDLDLTNLDFLRDTGLFGQVVLDS